jgi:hypothetical protein
VAHYDKLTLSFAAHATGLPEYICLNSFDEQAYRWLYSKWKLVDRYLSKKEQIVARNSVIPSKGNRKYKLLRR